MIKIQFAETPAEIKRCYPVIVQLRPHLSEEDFVIQVERMQKNRYQLAFIEDEHVVRSLAGFHISESLAWGKYLYVDDFITDEKNRAKGYGKKLFAWVIDYAKREECDQLHLDSGVQRERFDAHRFYLNQKMNITAHHFVLDLKI
jgi:GNAT superfamily N-acetyltransferase